MLNSGPILKCQPFDFINFTKLKYILKSAEEKNQLYPSFGIFWPRFEQVGRIILTTYVHVSVQKWTSSESGEQSYMIPVHALIAFRTQASFRENESSLKTFQVLLTPTYLWIHKSSSKVSPEKETIVSWWLKIPILSCCWSPLSGSAGTHHEWLRGRLHHSGQGESKYKSQNKLVQTCECVKTGVRVHVPHKIIIIHREMQEQQSWLGCVT